MKRRKLIYYGRIIRKTNCLGEDLIEGCTCTRIQNKGSSTKMLQERRYRRVDGATHQSGKICRGQKQWKDVKHDAHASAGGWYCMDDDGSKAFIRVCLCASVCLFVRTCSRTKTAETTIIKLATEIVHHESWLSV